MTREYWLPNSNGDKIFVCKTMFMSTLGYSADKFCFLLCFAVFKLSLSFILPPKPRRGLGTTTTYVTDKWSISNNFSQYRPLNPFLEKDYEINYKLFMKTAEF